MTETISAEIISAVLQMKRMTKEQWKTSQYIPRDGEPVCESDTGFMKVGDGTHRFTELKYMSGPQGPQGVQGIQGPPGRDGVVTFENLSQAQRNSLKGDRGERGEPGPQGPTGPRGADGQPGQRGADGARGATGERGPAGERGATGPAGPTGERGHSLNAIARIEGSYKNNATSPLNLFVYVYFDGQAVTDGVLLNIWYRESSDSSGQTLDTSSIDTDGKVYTWSAAQRSGELLQVILEVTYRGLHTLAIARIDNVHDGARGADGQQGQNIINQNGGQPMKYWSGTKAEYDAISQKDDNTIYDIKER